MIFRGEYMKRSQINQAIEYVIDKAKEFKVPLPPFAYYTPDEWKIIKEDEMEIIDNMLGWDVTDFGTGEFLKTGLTVFVFRNGNAHNKKKYPKPYCEKLLYVREAQILPYHFHWHKMEDIINRGGGDLRLTLWQSDKSEKFTDNDVMVHIDGKRTVVKAGGSITIKPGQSITLLPYQYHTWQGVPGTGDVIVFEVSTTNDDHSDNRFYESQERIPTIEEDEEAKFCMFADYQKRMDF